ncbi:MAG TPA: type III pantothenate kinase [Rubricoccaceae bacterium]|nr:type III pantothenate kinase [Rubricoccaceae bacterium]
MFLALDIGNSAVKAGLYGGDAWRVERFPFEDAGRLAGAFGAAAVSAAGLASVVPTQTTTWAGAARRAFGVDPVLLTVSMPLPFRMGYRTPETLGTDRLAAAAAAFLLFGRPAEGVVRPVVALDAGTAWTLDVVDGEGVYRGGAIAPGPDLLRRSLSRGTAQLPEVTFDLPASPIGGSTTEALQAGLLFPFLDGLAGLLDRVSDELGARPFTVLTGGWGPFLYDHLPGRFDAVAPHLVLDGIRLLVEGWR